MNHPTRQLVYKKTSFSPVVDGKTCEKTCPKKIMATLRLTIIKNKPLKDGRLKIKVSVCHKGETSYINTRYTVDSPTHWKDGQVIKEADSTITNSNLRGLMDFYQARLDSIHTQHLYSCKQLKDMLIQASEQEEKPTYGEFCKEYIKELHHEGRHSYAVLIERSMRYFLEFAKVDIRLEDMTTFIITNFKKYLLMRKKVSETTANMMLSQIKAVVNRAVQYGKVTYNIHPFITTKIGRAPVRDLAISRESLITIRDCNPVSYKYCVARDMFMLSFYLCGMNLVDIMSVDFSDDDSIAFKRTKIKNRTLNFDQTVLHIPYEARAIINKYIGKNGKLNLNYKYTLRNLSQYLGSTITELAAELGVQEKVVFTSARKSFAQFAHDLGVSDSIIDYCLGHSSYNRGVISYYAKDAVRHAKIVIDRVIDYVDNPHTYDDYINMRSERLL